MKNNSNKWLDVQVVLITLFMTISLFLWNLFAGGGSRQTTTPTTTSQQTDPVPASSVQTLPSGVRILLGGAAPKNQSITLAQAPAQAPAKVITKAPAKAQSRPPAPVTVTKSSRP